MKKTVTMLKHLLAKPLNYKKRRMVSRDIMHQYFKDPLKAGLRDERDLAERYLDEGYNERSHVLVKLIQKYASPKANILEIGCCVGRNLNFLFSAGFKNLTGIEISERAVKILRQTYPVMAQNTKIHIAPVEEVIKEFRNWEFDVVFVMAVLEHIHNESKWVFSEIARITKSFLIIFEDELHTDWHKIPRNYKKIFERFGMKQIMEIGRGEKFEGLSVEGTKPITNGMTIRIFQINHSDNFYGKK